MLLSLLLLAPACGSQCPRVAVQPLATAKATPCNLPQLPTAIAPEVSGEYDRVSMTVADYTMVLQYLVGLRSWIGAARDCLVMK